MTKIFQLIEVELQEAIKKTGVKLPKYYLGKV